MRHLPGIIEANRRADGAFTLVTACGKRGPVEARENGAPPADLFPEASTWERGICRECLVRWDRAEEEGSLQVVWSLNGKTGWAAGGAVVFLKPPLCPACETHPFFKHAQSRAQVFAAVAR